MHLPQEIPLHTVMRITYDGWNPPREVRILLVLLAVGLGLGVGVRVARGRNPPREVRFLLGPNSDPAS